MTSRRDFIRALTVTASSGGLLHEPGAVAHDPTSSMVRDVRAFGAKGDGTTDDTASFNAATDAEENWHEGAVAAIIVPPGIYRIDGTVFVRRGQDFSGAGDATIIDASRARGRTIVLGGSERGRDPGGAPASLSRLRFLGGSGHAPLIHAGIEGFAIRDLFISAAGTAIEINAADGIVSGIVVDQALNGLVLRGARNVLIDGLVTYLTNYAVTVDRETSDIGMANMILAYSRNASILFAEGATGITSIRVADATFVSSIQYPDFVGHVHARASGFDAQFTSCVLRNWREHAVVQGAGSGADLSFSNCVFDAARSHPSYNVSNTAKGIRTGADGRFRLNNCRFRHLLGEVATIGPGLSILSIVGGAVEESSSDPIRITAAPAGRLRVRGVEGFGRQVDSGGVSGLVLPWLGTSSAWQVVATRRGSPGGMTSATVAVTEERGIVSCVIHETARHGVMPPLAAGFGETPGGAGHTTFDRGSGRICVSAPVPALDWSVESIG